MRFLSMVKLTEGKSSPPSKAMIDAVNQLVQEVAKEGCVMVQSGGLYPTSAGARVRLAGGKITVTDGPFTEAKEIVGGYAIFDVPSKAHMIRVTERFMALHKTHMPGWEGECELRQLAAPGEPEPCGQPREAEAAV
ncbi:MAG TPA: YciI family protein [Methyloceanibacter sp.]|jgi:hypothetical protein|nr:YciI family protein [Methyloceanibacter sp.]